MTGRPQGTLCYLIRVWGFVFSIKTSVHLYPDLDKTSLTEWPTVKRKMSFCCQHFCSNSTRLWCGFVLGAAHFCRFCKIWELSPSTGGWNSLCFAAVVLLGRMGFHHVGERCVSWSFSTKLEFFGPSGSEDNSAAMDTWRQCVQLGFSTFVTKNGWIESSEGEETKAGKHQQHLQSTELRLKMQLLCH